MQGFPVYGSGAFSQVSWSVDHMPKTHLRQLAGNSMHVAAVGTTIAYALAATRARQQPVHAECEADVKDIVGKLFAKLVEDIRA